MKNNRLISFIALIAVCVLPIALRGQVLSTPSSAKPISEDLKLFRAPSSLSASGKPGFLAYDATYFYCYDPTTRAWKRYGGGTNSWTAAANRIPYFNGTPVEATSAGLRFTGSTLAVGQPTANTGTIQVIGGNSTGSAIMEMVVRDSGGSDIRNIDLVQSESAKTLNLTHQDDSTNPVSDWTINLSTGVFTHHQPVTFQAVLTSTVATGAAPLVVASTTRVSNLNVATAGTSDALTTTRSIYGNNFDGSAALTQIIASIYGGTGNGFTKFSGPTTAERTKTLRDASDTVLELGGSYTPSGTWVWTSASVTWPTFNQNTSGSAATLTTNRAIYGNNFNGSAALTQIIASTYGGTGNGFLKFSGPTTSEKTYTGPDSNATLLTDAAAVTVAQGGSGRQTGTTAYSLIATGTTATGAQQTLANGATTEMLVGGGASALPVWTTATGTGSPVRSTAPTIAGAADFTGTVNRSTSDTITITTNAGVIDVTKGDGSATNSAATSLTFSTDNVAATRYLTRDLVNSDGSNARVFTFDTVTDFTVTVPASSTIPVTMKSQGASGWARVGGASNIVDLTANGAPAITDVVELVNPTTGVSTKSLKVLAGADAGANDTYAVTLSPAITGYSTGQHYRFKANTANTGAATINFNSVGAATIKKFTSASPGADLADNDIRAGQWVDLVYDGTNMQMQSAVGNAGSGGGTPGGSDTQIQYNNSSAFGANSGLVANKTSGAVTQIQTALGTTATAGLTLQNTTAAANGAQQVAPSLLFEGLGWGTTAGTSQRVAWNINILPVQSTVPTGTLQFQSAIAAGALTNRMTLTSAGVLNVTGAGIFGAGVDVNGSYTTSASGGGFAAGSTGGFNWGGTKSYIKSVSDGTIAMTNFAGTSVANITGSATNDSASAGSIGEYVSSLIASGSAVSLTTATAANVTSISLTAGDWDVEGNINYSAASATVTGTQGGTSSTSATLPTDGSEVFSGVQVTLLSETDSVTLPRKRFSLSGTTTVYLVGKSTFSAGTVSAYGAVTARRVR